MKEFLSKKPVKITIKIFLTILTVMATLYGGLIGFLMIAMNGYFAILAGCAFGVIPIIAIPLIWFKKKKKWFLIGLSIVLVWGILLGINVGLDRYDKSLIVNTAPNINIEAYLPFVENTKIVKVENATLQLSDNLPIIDGAAAVFPVYSSFVYSVYPQNTQLQTSEYLIYGELEEHYSKNSPFQYNNTRTGYKLLGEKEIDIFFGAYPSKEQIATAEKTLDDEYVWFGDCLEGILDFAKTNAVVLQVNAEDDIAIYVAKKARYLIPAEDGLGAEIRTEQTVKGRIYREVYEGEEDDYFYFVPNTDKDGNPVEIDFSTILPGTAVKLLSK